MAKKVAIGIAVGLAILLVILSGLAAARPNRFFVQRSIGIRAAPHEVFANIDDFHRWGAWVYPNAPIKTAFGGAPSGKGAVYQWEGNFVAGKGRLEIIDAAAPTKVTIKIDFATPIAAPDTTEFTLRPEGDSTIVTWAIYGPWAIHGPTVLAVKMLDVLLDVDDMFAGDLETGLANLKAVTESMTNAGRPHSDAPYRTLRYTSSINSL